MGQRLVVPWRMEWPRQQLASGKDDASGTTLLQEVVEGVGLRWSLW